MGLRRLIGVAGIVSALVILPASASAATGYAVSAIEGRTSGTFTWLNRSVQNQGSVIDRFMGSEYTQVAFFRYTASTLRGVDTRSAYDTQRSFNFTLDGSPYPGGITKVLVSLCSDEGCGLAEATYFRP